MTADDRYLIVSADTHAGPTPDILRPYFDAAHRAAYDEWLAEREVRKARMLESLPTASLGESVDMGLEQMSAWASHPSLQPGGHPALCDPHLRITQLDEDGCAADVIFPDFPHLVSNEPPFGLVTGGHKEVAGGINRRGTELYDVELQWAGARAYNRWLADFCSVEPARHAGIALVPLYDVDAAVAEITFARESGLRGGILLQGRNDLMPRYNDPALDPVWACCEELGMAVNTHAGNEVPDYGPGPDALAIMQTEVMFYSHRPLAWLLWGGVFERHPGLKFVLTEQLADWVPPTLRELETVASTAGRAAGLPMRPREYWDRQCYVGATFMSRGEAELRHEIGVGNIMWGSDYPHPEGTWPHTAATLRNAYAGLPEDDIAAMLGTTAIDVYGFDGPALRAVADRIGPTVADVAVPLEERPKDYVGQAFR